jgi:hypothetical protein
MHDTGAKCVAALRQGLAAAQQRVYQCPAGITRSGVHGHASRFVDGNHVVIFVENFECNGLRFGAKRRPGLDFYGDAFAIPNMVGTFSGPGIDEYQATLDKFLGTGAAEVESRGNRLIKALSGIASAYDKFLEGRFVTLAHAEIVAAVRAVQARMPF